jgi:hypothetical protein
MKTFMEYGFLFLLATLLCGALADRHVKGRDLLPFGMTSKDLSWYGFYLVVGTLFGITAAMSVFLHNEEAINQWPVLILLGVPAPLAFFLMGMLLPRINRPIV